MTAQQQTADTERNWIGFRAKELGSVVGTSSKQPLASKCPTLASSKRTLGLMALDRRKSHESRTSRPEAEPASRKRDPPAGSGTRGREVEPAGRRKRNPLAHGNSRILRTRRSQCGAPSACPGTSGAPRSGVRGAGEGGPRSWSCTLQEACGSV